LSGDKPASATLLEHAKRFHGLLGADAILEYLCREARQLAGSQLAVASYVSPGESWQRGVHVAVDVAVAPVTPAMVSATFALHRRLAMKPEPLVLSASDESAAIFRGLLGGLAVDGQSSLWALPLRNRRERLIGQVVLATAAPDALRSSSAPAILDLLSLASLALETAERLAFARRDQDRLLLLAEATAEALWDWDFESNAFWWGGGIQNVIRHGSEIIGTTPGWKFDRIHHQDVSSVRASLDRARSSNESTWAEEYRFRRGDGSWAIVEDRAYFLRDASGRAYRMLGALRDVSDKKWIEAQQNLLVHASAALAASLEVEKNLETVADLATHTVADWCCIVLFGIESAKPPTIAVAHRDRDRAQRVSALLERAFQEPIAAQDEMVAATVVADFGDDHRRWLESRVPGLEAVLGEVAPASALHVPLLTDNRVLGLITLTTSTESMRSYGAPDRAFAEEFARRCSVAVDKARLYEQAQDAIRARDAFMAILGHELRNPLSPISTALHLMKLRDPRSAREQEVIERQVKHLTRLVDDLLDVSRIERGKVELSKRPVQLAEIVAKAVEIASPLLEQRRHRLELNVSPTGLPLLADETRVAQVVANLLTNAARYTDEGGSITISATRDKKEITLRVRDNGIGMSPELLPRVFDLFVQGPRTAERRQGGLGLGLSLVRSLVALHGGNVEAHSDGLGKGSEFVVRLPAMAVELVTSDRQAAPECVPASHRRRVLLVDDNEDAAELLMEVLTSHGHDVRVANDGPQALIAAPTFEPDVAILDIGLPVMDGYELAGRLIAILPRRPFLIALTGYGQEQDRALAREAGFDEHMVKPVDPQRLVSSISGARPSISAQAERH
jgi:signal transduction histidine kinase/ActR/RegA family two-component response regulator/PAS domain-containing protein